MTKAELDKVLKNHAAWLRGDKGGVRADLYGADLIYTFWYVTKLDNAFFFCNKINKDNSLLSLLDDKRCRALWIV